MSGKKSARRVKTGRSSTVCPISKHHVDLQGVSPVEHVRLSATSQAILVRNVRRCYCRASGLQGEPVCPSSDLHLQLPLPRPLLASTVCGLSAHAQSRTSSDHRLSRRFNALPPAMLAAWLEANARRNGRRAGGVCDYRSVATIPMRALVQVSHPQRSLGQRIEEREETYHRLVSTAWAIHLALVDKPRCAMITRIPPRLRIHLGPPTAVFPPLPKSNSTSTLTSHTSSHTIPTRSFTAQLYSPTSQPTGSIRSSSSPSAPSPSDISTPTRRTRRDHPARRYGFNKPCLP